MIINFNIFFELRYCVLRHGTITLVHAPALCVGVFFDSNKYFAIKKRSLGNLKYSFSLGVFGLSGANAG